MLRPYLDLLAVPGGRVFSGAAFLARLPIAMIGLGIVLLVVAEHGRYGLAGALSATFALVNAVSAPAIARMVDRFGQRRVITPSVAVHSAGLGTFVALVSAGAPLWSVWSAVVLAGLTGPSIGSLVRARWSHVLATTVPGGTAKLHTAYAYEAVLDEAIFVLGPLLATMLATKVAPEAGLVAAAVLVVAGSTALLAHRASEPPAAAGHQDGHPSAVRSPGLIALLPVMLFIGGVFGSVEISTVAFADESGSRARAGALLACYAGGSMLAGLLFGAVHWRASARLRLAIGALVMTATALPLTWIGSTPTLALALFVAGVGIAPTLISAFSLVERIVPAGTVTEGLAWATTGLVVGFSAATWVSGRLVDTASVATAFTVATGSGLCALAVCAVAFRRLPTG